MFQPVGHVDVLHPDYQRLVSEVAQDLLRTDIDGLVVGARRAKGFAEEWSPTSRRMFEGLFGPSFDSQDQCCLTRRMALGWVEDEDLSWVCGTTHPAVATDTTGTSGRRGCS